LPQYQNYCFFSLNLYLSAYAEKILYAEKCILSSVLFIFYFSAFVENSLYNENYKWRH